ncbi:DNA repair protein XRCC3 isoform X1 [Monodelphis domestica]|uniref:DNA repair protein n=1 Tax=Monodelphis domestica TaxID=13616 RepID=F7D6P0_MONDO|nr:DNA repair protein XRCC3 isoform X1 [Monodelphis domestica]XP_007473562.1 DNA repair protein XRCC3 isoform X1 [Monodelphis domestica]XP_007473564.1 DNA repair protein XRCC3 isoform X1 [Monodelphis domestica]XP_056667184.1 DNA repair protein XRCC3 isoform X1 [Monodelphis domestica]
MDWDQLELNPKVIAAIKKAKLKSIKEVLHFSGPDLQRLTKLSSIDVQHLLKTVSLALRNNCVLTALHIYQHKEEFPAQHKKLGFGCPVFNRLLQGGLPLVGITELVGQSSAGKTQIGLQLSLCVQYPYEYGGLESGAIYICTEDVFPDKRLQQLIALQHQLRTDVPQDVIKKIKFGNSIFIEHAADIDALFECVTKRAPILLSRGMVRLIIIDSIAALFRCEFGIQHSITKAKYLQTLGAKLHQLSSGFQSPVLCINQVTDTVDERGLAGTNLDVLARVSPALGITWSNQLLMRLMVSRLARELSRDTHAAATGTVVRTLSVIFAPHLPQSCCHYTVSAEGVKGAE